MNQRRLGSVGAETEGGGDYEIFSREEFVTIDFRHGASAGGSQAFNVQCVTRTVLQDELVGQTCGRFLAVEADGTEIE